MLTIIRNPSFIALFISMALSMSLLVILISIGGSIGFSLSDKLALATLPISTSIIGTFCFLYPASYIGKLLGRRASFLIGGFFGIIGTCTAWYALIYHHFWLFCMGTFILGFQAATAQYYRFAAIELIKPDLRALALSLVMAGGILSAFIGPTIATFTAKLFDLRFSATIMSMVILSVLITAVIGLLYRPNQENNDADDQKQRNEQLAISESTRKLGLLTAVASGAIGYGVMVLLMNTAPLTMQHHYDFSFEASARVIQWHVLAMYVPALFSGKLIQKLGAKTVIHTGIAIYLLIPLIALTGNQLHHFTLELILLGIGWNFTFVGGSYLLTRNTLPEQKAFVQGTNDSVVFLCNMAGSFLAGYFLSMLSWSQLTLFIFPLALPIIILYFQYTRRLSQEPLAPEKSPSW